MAQSQASATVAQHVAHVCVPDFRRQSVAAVDEDDVVAALQPIWRGKRETAERLRGRIERVLNWATVNKYRDGLNPARWRGHLKELLGDAEKEVEHFPALPYADIPQFMPELRRQSGIGARALEFLILNAVRTAPVIGAMWSEVDLEKNTCTVPPDRMKGRTGKRRPRTVPLSTQALAILKSL